MGPIVHALDTWFAEFYKICNLACIRWKVEKNAVSVHARDLLRHTNGCKDSPGIPCFNTSEPLPWNRASPKFPVELTSTTGVPDISVFLEIAEVDPGGVTGKVKRSFLLWANAAAAAPTAAPAANTAKWTTELVGIVCFLVGTGTKVANDSGWSKVESITFVCSLLRVHHSLCHPWISSAPMS